MEDNSNEPNRREFVKKVSMVSASVLLATSTSTLLTGCSTITYISQSPLIPKDAYSIAGDQLEIDLSKVPDLAFAGDSASIEDDSLLNFLLIAKTGKDNFVVVSSECTHRGKALRYKHDEGVFQCSSLGSSKFGLDGKVISGPADKPLKVFYTNLTGNKLIIEYR